MASQIKKVAEKAPGWFTRVLMPEIAEIKADVKILQRGQEEMDRRINARLDALAEKVDYAPRVAVLEEQVKELQRRKS